MAIINDPTAFYPQPGVFSEPSGALTESFNNLETEIAAAWLLKLAQERGEGWVPFTLADIEAIHGDNFFFCELLSRSYIVEENGYYFFTEEFVNTIHPRHRR